MKFCISVLIYYYNVGFILKNLFFSLLFYIFAHIIS